MITREEDSLPTEFHLAGLGRTSRRFSATNPGNKVPHQLLNRYTLKRHLPPVRCAFAVSRDPREAKDERDLHGGRLPPPKVWLIPE
jgi:hypothetical protein